jgi:hypothetical protein
MGNGEESVRNFVDRVKGQASKCDFSVGCTACETALSYMEEVVKHQLLRGLADTDIQELVLGEEDNTLEETVKYVEGKELGKRSGG